jgi:hypothetical protein
MTYTLTAGDDLPSDRDHQPQDRDHQPQDGDHQPPSSGHQPQGRAPGPPGRPDQPPTLLVRASTPADLLRLVPHLLGFRPAASLVVIGVAPPRDRIRLTLRYDLPDPPGAHLVADVAAHAVAVLRKQRLKAVVAIGYGAEALVTPMARALRAAVWQDRIDLLEFLRVEDGRYWSYVCGNEECCPVAGVPFDDGADDPAEAALAEVGPVLASRADLAARVAPLGYITSESMRQATRRAEQRVTRLLARVRRASRLGAARHLIAIEGLTAVGTMIARYRDGGRFSTDDEIARITVALRDLRVRDDAWARMDPEYAAAHQRLWTDVVRRAQPGYVAAPASLLAFVAWQSGNGALANVALDRALADDPGYSMAALLRQAIDSGAPPALARLPMTPEEVAASYDGLQGPDADDSTADRAAMGDAPEGSGTCRPTAGS